MLITIIGFELDLTCHPVYISTGDALEERHALHDTFNRACIIQPLKEAFHRRDDLHHTLYDFLRHLKHQSGSLCTRGHVAWLSGKHTMFAHELSTVENCYW